MSGDKAEAKRKRIAHEVSRLLRLGYSVPISVYLNEDLASTQNVSAFAGAFDEHRERLSEEAPKGDATV